jgi:hypothetical protein
MIIFWLLLAGAAAVAGQAPAAGPANPTIAEALRSTRSAIGLTPDGLAGDGAKILQSAIAPARFVAIGEDHATREIPALVSRLCKQNASALSALVVEAGPRALTDVVPLLKSPDRVARMEAFDTKYPDAIAFLNIRADSDMAAECLTAQPGLKIVGIDQEFLGASGLLIDQILREKLAPRARAALLSLKRSERDHERKAAALGDPADLLLIGGSDREFSEAEAALRSGGSARARAIFADLLRSRRIYRTSGNDSNELRADLLKANLAAQIPANGKILLKMGDWHLYRGYNPLNNRDVGNWVAEKADIEGEPSLHILVLGLAGVHALYDGYGKPWRHAPFTFRDDPDYRWLEAAQDAREGMPQKDWALFDLRPLRHQQIAGIDVAWRRVLDGYDLLIVIPQLTPSDMVQASMQKGKISNGG